ncbi:hypothetical protein J4P02_01620 [Pseudomonas sp. NFXW11]|uniref:NACHT domain-containing protein n=1 Tax=Pseudomonas sp. NFXW11 TaxID=2819531 RepID=UPI003CF42E09
MIDRKVRAIDGSTGCFGDFQQASCLVLLGDPGAGKSHLFEAVAQQSGARYLQVREFLRIKPGTVAAGSTLFLDALDEYRVHYGDAPAIDRLVSHLGELQGCRVRISCRNADWIRSDDLQALKDCFPQEHAVQELHLLPLDEAEQLQVLGSLPQVAEDFLTQARQRGLEEMLGNPLTLRMLAQVVAQAQWPRTRRELFERSCQVLLSEDNSTHRNDRRLRAELSEAELLRAAGLLCAVRLLADIDGFSVQQQGSQRLASLAALNLCPPKALRAALASRVFSACAEPGVFDHSHKAIAEYLAAGYLGELFQEGLPLSRIRLLLGGEGRPVSYLRGLHAWLPFTLCAHALEFIQADPMGVLRYGDAASLSSHGKRQLFQALADLAESDPGFRGQDYSSQALAGLAEPALVECFRGILEAPAKHHELKILVLDTLRVGQPLPALLEVLAQLLASPDAHANECAYAAQILSQWGEQGLQALHGAYQTLLSDGRGRRLRAFILSRVLGAADYPDLLALYRLNAQRLQEHEAALARWELHKLVATGDIPQCLDGLLAIDSSGLSEAAALDAINFMVPLIIRYLGAQEPPDETRLFGWLAGCSGLSSYKGYRPFQELAEALSNCEQSRAPGLLLRAADYPGLEDFPFPKAPADKPGEIDAEFECIEAEDGLDDPFLALVNSAVDGLEQQLDGGYPVQDSDPFFLGEVLFKLIKQEALADKPWFQALRRDHYGYYIDCLAQHLLSEVITSGMSHCLRLKHTGQVPLADKLDAVRQLLKYAPNLDQTQFYHLLRHYCRHLSLDQFGPELQDLLAKDEAAQHHAFITALGLLMSLETFAPHLEALDSAGKNAVLWYLRDWTGLVRGFDGPMDMSAQQVACFCRLMADQYPATPEAFDWFTPANTRPEDADEFIWALIGFLAGQPSRAAGEHLLSLQVHPSLASWKGHLKHALAIYRTRQHDAQFIRSSWQEVRDVLQNGAPANIMHMQALVLDELHAVASQLRSNLNGHKFFWNEVNGKIDSPKWENSCRDALLSLLRPRLDRRGISAEPEGQMLHGNRVDIAVQHGSIKLVIELKRTSHVDLWTSIEKQLVALYTSDPGARGYGIYGVFWHGLGAPITQRPGEPGPQSAAELKQQLEATIAEELRPYIKVFVLDVSGA